MTFHILIIELISYLFLIILSIFVHELGHALMILFLTDNEILIKLGTRIKEAKVKFKIKRIEIHVSFKNPFIGFTYYDDNGVSWIKQTLISIGGPLASVIATIICFKIKDKYTNEFLALLQSNTVEIKHNSCYFPD